MPNIYNPYATPAQNQAIGIPSAPDSIRNFSSGSNPYYISPTPVNANANDPTRQFTSPGGYNANPISQTYNPVYGGIPGNIPLPNPFGDLSNVVPGLGGLNSQASGDLAAQFGGQLSPGTINQIQDAAAQWGAGAGMPGFSPGSLGGNLGLRNIGMTAEQQIQNAFNNYAKFIPTASSTQTVNPSLEAEIAALNAFINAAPNPASAGSHAEQLFNKYLNSLRGPGGGTSGAFGSPSAGTSAGSGALGFGFGTFGGGGPGSTFGGGFGDSFGIGGPIQTGDYTFDMPYTSNTGGDIMTDDYTFTPTPTNDFYDQSYFDQGGL